jgi:hypothetical protein
MIMTGPFSTACNIDVLWKRSNSWRSSRPRPSIGRPKGCGVLTTVKRRTQRTVPTSVPCVHLLEIR